MNPASKDDAIRSLGGKVIRCNLLRRSYAIEALLATHDPLHAAWRNVETARRLRAHGWNNPEIDRLP